MPPKAPSKAEERILREAARLFAESGYRGTSVRRICQAAGVNVAAVNYYFRSKEHLYHEVFRMLFEDFGRPLQDLADTATDARSWKAALGEWIRRGLDLSTRDDPPHLWASRLFARERTEPSSVFPLLFTRFFRPVQEGLDRLIRMGLPGDAPDSEVRVWTASLLSLFTYFANRRPPWDRLIFPADAPREAWIRALARHTLEGITARLRYRGPRRNGGRAR